jgi:cullin 3
VAVAAACFRDSAARDCKSSVGQLGSQHHNHFGRAVWRQHDRATAEVFEARILTTSVWSNLKIVNLRITDQMRQSLEVFGNFYATRFSGRRLTWVHSQGSVDLKFVTGGSIVVLSVSTIQAVILLLFNEKTQLSLEEILKDVNLDLPEAKRHLLSLFVNPKCKLLIKSTAGTQLEMEDRFILNADFETKSRHVKVPLLVDNTAPEVTGGSTGDIDTGAGLEQVVQEDRKHLIEAAIVRVMKLKRQLDHNGLVVEVANHLGNRFIPSVQMIKERVENLIDREFIARDNDDVKLYYYVA